MRIRDGKNSDPGSGTNIPIINTAPEEIYYTFCGPKVDYLCTCILVPRVRLYSVQYNVQ
jgi:hypothetical protein